ncbi:hypothetical protein WJ972_28860 [Achromobacter insuavis]
MAMELKRQPGYSITGAVESPMGDLGHAGFIGCMTISSVTPSSPFVSLEAFAKAAESGQDVYVDVAGEKLQVLGMGATPGGRSVAWVAPNVDTTEMFAQALARSFGQGIASAVSRELGLGPTPASRCPRAPSRWRSTWRRPRATRCPASIS